MIIIQLNPLDNDTKIALESFRHMANVGVNSDVKPVLPQLIHLTDSIDAVLSLTTLDFI
jgi:hypothetical protein